ncbi:MAG: hypothetical protein QME14_02675, partial [Methanobacteriaceae archaeon]|nr:hypothetical protein [Methanobacteriaceae archaeon]
MHFTFEQGGGIIKRHSIFALLFALGIAMLAIPSSVGVMDSVNNQENAKIELDNKEIQQVSAATYKRVRYKKWYRSNGRWRYYWATRYVKTTNSRVSAARTSTTTVRNSNYRPIRYKKWYRSNGRWRYYWATR